MQTIYLAPIKVSTSGKRYILRKRARTSLASAPFLPNVNTSVNDSLINNNSEKCIACDAPIDALESFYYCDECIAWGALHRRER